MPWMGRRTSKWVADGWRTLGGLVVNGWWLWTGGCGREVVVGAAAPRESCGERVVSRLWTGGGRAVVGEASALLGVRPAKSSHWTRLGCARAGVAHDLPRVGVGPARLWEVLLVVCVVQQSR